MMKQKNNYLYLKKKKIYSIQNFRGGSGAGSLSVRTHPAISQNAEKCLQMLYLLARFQKKFPGEAPRTPRFREVWGRKSSWKIGGWLGKEIKLVGTGKKHTFHIDNK